MSVLPHIDLGFCTTPVEIQKAFFCEICQADSKINMEEQRAWIPKMIRKNNKEQFVLLNGKIYYKVTFLKDKVIST